MSKNCKTKPSAALAVILAWLIPGAGHFYLGRTVRGVILFIVIGATFWAGVAMGGKLTVDHRSEPYWFVAQMCSGVHGLIGWQRQRDVYERVQADPRLLHVPVGEGPGEYRQSIIDERLQGQGLAMTSWAVETSARAYSGVAGLLNLMCIFDALMLGLMGTTGEAARKETAEAGE